MSTVSGSHSISRQQRNSTSADQHVSLSAQSPHGSAFKKTRKMKTYSPKPVPSAPVSSTLNTTHTHFDVKSIVPESKSQKTISKLLESSKQHSLSQSCSYECIDGSIRNFNTQTATYTVHEEPRFSSSSSEAPKASSSVTRVPEEPIVRPTATTSGDIVHVREQFKAYGIEAYPTRALHNEICYDFVSKKRWCPHGAQCFRLHPLDKQKYLADVIHQSVVIWRTKYGHDRSHTLPSSIETQHANSVIALQPPSVTQYSQSSTSAIPTTALSPSPRFQNASGHVSRQGKSKSSDDEPLDNMKIKKTPWGDRAPSDTSSEGGQQSSDTGIWGLRFPSASDWDSPEISPPQAPSPPKISSNGVSRTNVTQASSKQSSIVPSENAQVRKRHPRPDTNEVCRKWLRDQCTLGYDCKYIHHTLDYDDPGPIPVRRPPETFQSTFHNHMRVQFGAGLEVQEFKTGFESQWIMLSNLPSDTSDYKIKQVLQPFGEVLDIRRPNPNFNWFKIQFAKSSDAYTAFTTLHGTAAFGKKLEVRMSIEAKDGGTVITDTVVRLDWDAPTRTVYMGYASEDKANEAVSMSRRRPYQNFWTTAQIHIGIPAVGLVTVKFDNLPFDVTEEGMEVFGPHQGMVTARPNYKDCTLEESISGIHRLLSQYKGKIHDVDIRPPPYRGGKLRAWAYFNTATDAKQAAENLHGRKPMFMGFTKVSARHIKTLNFSLAQHKFAKVESGIRAFADDIFQQGGGYSLTIVPKNAYFALRLCGEDMKTLSRLKAELERTINGETLTEGGNVAWDDFFGGPAGSSYLCDIEKEHPGVKIEKDIGRRVLRLYGPMAARAEIRDKILSRIRSLCSQKVHIIPFDGRLGIALLEGGFRDLQAKLGEDNAMLDLWSRVMRIQGDMKAYNLAMNLLNKVRVSQKFVERIIPGRECPVCFEDPVLPVRLPCGHSWCKACLQRYLQASIEHKFFPLTCLGKEAKCTERIPLFTIREMLDAAEMQAITNAAFTHHIQSHSNEFHFCPTADCDQVYRTTSSGVFIQCPSCLVRICPNCHADAHDGLTCTEFKHGDDLFRDWAAKNSVKRCPGCKIAIEKDEGCNHMVCTMCKTHICWVCMKTFPNGDGIYGHMRIEHGGFGLMDPF